jgi:UDP-GlcNAc:undecaprenyl-phosphate GlcNAc-1-phosphate transferase
LLTIPVRWLAVRYGWVDRPDGRRKRHARVTPSIGGLAIVGGLVAGVALTIALQQASPFGLSLPPVQLWIAAALIVGTGFYDDIRGMNFRTKFGLQLVVAFLLVSSGLRLDLTPISFLGDDPLLHAAFSTPLSMLWIVGLINAINLIDGLDGLAAGVTYIAICCFAIIYGASGDVAFVALSVPVAGAVAGFLILNFRNASIFMGDSGSLFLGFVLAVASLHGGTHSNLALSTAIPILVLGVPVLDTALCVVRRSLTGRSLFSADHDHIHHRMIRRWSPTKVVVYLYGVAILFGGAAIVMSNVSTQAALVVLVLTVVAAILGVYALGYLSALPKVFRTWITQLNAALKRLPVDADVTRSRGSTSSQAIPAPSQAVHAENGQLGMSIDGRPLAETPSGDGERKISVEDVEISVSAP